MAGYAFERLQLNAMRKNRILPKALQDVASAELHFKPLNSCYSRIHDRCTITSRAYNVDKRYHLGRMVFRHLADHGNLSGVQRAIY
ncbi:28S ribosomal protein S14 [Tropilaelaps mercedesae]|uniref:28S ribosomal protein S14 n=1 Tax=Tropilaelaps mercedesae TaxID=418985 RepID=A0A1V9XPM8_9ACAR|nr:28S ribosomal protein S14 [Tropilaelaps mercedesae]